MIDIIDFKRYEENEDKNIEYYYDKNKQRLMCLNNLSKVNIFIGENNSGKSRLMRNIYVTKRYNFLNTEKKNLTTEFEEQIKIYNNYIGYAGIPILRDFLKEYKEIDDDNINGKISFILNNLEDIRLNKKFERLGNMSTSIIYNLRRIVDKCKEEEGKRIYIPILRGIESFKQIVQSVDKKINQIRLTSEEREIIDKYLNQIEEIYYKKVKESYFKNQTNDEIHTGESMYNEIQKKLLGTEEEREEIRAFEKFLSVNFFDDKLITLNPNINKKFLCVNINGEERELYNLGEGIKQIIIITYKMFSNRDKPVTFFIEEPELNLHPGLQRKLLETMLSEEFKNQQFFITTHSNHLLDLTLDYENISVYKFNNIGYKEKQSLIQVRQIEKGDNSILKDLGVKDSSVFLSNCTIWVEGITDRLYIRRYLDLYQDYLLESGQKTKKFKEDINYSFIEYGGGNITHWSFLDTQENEDSIKYNFITKNIFLVADNDCVEKDTKKFIRNKILKENLKQNYYQLKCREIENLISFPVLKRVVETRENKEIQFIPEVLDENEYKESHLGEFINERVKGRRHKYTYSNKNVLYNKSDFCHRCLIELKHYNDMGNEAKKLVKKIYEFIEKNN